MLSMGVLVDDLFTICEGKKKITRQRSITVWVVYMGGAGGPLGDL